MTGQVRCNPASWSFTPDQLLRVWPRTHPLAALCSSPAPHSDSRWARWSFLTSPTRTITIGRDEPDPIGRLAAEIDATRLPVTPHCPSPFAGGWFVALGYELGRTIEPTAAIHRSRTDANWPWSIVLWRCPWTLAYDHAESRWWTIQNPRGHAGATGADQSTSTPPNFPDALPDHVAESEYHLGLIAPIRPRDEYLRAVRRAIEYIHAGDAFQVNLAHHLGARFDGSTRSLFHDLLSAAGPWYGAYLELAQGNDLHAALSISPELFLTRDASTNVLTTRPIKGTRPGHTHPDSLLRSVKDQAELNMIVDLMRNDLGRICRPGSVRVAEARTIESHALRSMGILPMSDAHAHPRGTNHGRDARATERGVHHGVATIHGTLRPDRSIADLLCATFPGGSITGAPKVRAMQIIEELEPSPRGLYTGAIGFISDCGNLALNIAIRTALIRGKQTDPLNRPDEVADGSLSYGVGAGIVADSVPEQEWQETLDKAGTLLGVAEASHNKHAPVIARSPHRQGAAT